MESLAGYSLVSYLLNIKDRHNGNILLDNAGHIIHIDFGFVLTTSPGGNINFETSPFKLTSEYVDLMDGKDSDLFRYFKNLLFKGFIELKKHIDCFLYIIKYMMVQPKLQCLQTFNEEEFKARFKQNLTDIDLLEHVSKLVNQSYNNTRTYWYDRYQFKSQGIVE